MAGRPNKPKPAATPGTARIPNTPGPLSDIEKKEWRRVCKDLNRLGLLDSADTGIIYLYCTTWGRLIKAQTEMTKSGIVVRTPSGAAQQNIYLPIINKASEQLNRFAQQLGLTPSARARINAQPGEETTGEDDDEVPT